MPSPEQIQKMKEMLVAISSEINADLDNSTGNSDAVTGYTAMSIVPDEVSDNNGYPVAECFMNTGLAANFTDMPGEVRERQRLIYANERREAAMEFALHWSRKHPDEAMPEFADNVFQIIYENNLREEFWEFEHEWFNYGNDSDVLFAMRFSENEDDNFVLSLVVNQERDIFSSLNDKVYNSWTFTPEALEACDPDEFAKAACMDMFKQRPGGIVEENASPRP